MRQAACRFRSRTALRRTVTASLLLLLGLPACGGGSGLPDLGLGTVALVNATDVGQAPLVVDQFYIAPVGQPEPGPNRLSQALQPGGVVIVGLFPAGMYNAVAVLESGANVNFPPTEVRTGEPTNFVVPGP